MSVLDRQQDRAANWRRLLAAYDIERQLERGYTITLRPDGHLVRSVADLDPGAMLVTRFADGRARSTVQTTELRSTTEGRDMNAPRRDEHSDDDAEPVEQLSYMAASHELDGIVEFFERSEVDVDQLVARLERATAIVDELDRRIRRTRAQVEDLVPKLEAMGRATASSGSRRPRARPVTTPSTATWTSPRWALTVRGRWVRPRTRSKGDKLPF